MDRRGFLSTVGKVSAGAVIGGFGGTVWTDRQAQREQRELRNEYESRIARMRSENTYADRELQVSRQFTLNQGEQRAFQIEEPDDERRELRYVVIASRIIDVMAMSRDEYEKHEAGENAGADLTASSPSTKYGTGQTPFNQAITLLIDNTSSWKSPPSPGPVDVDVAYEVYE